MSDLVVISGVEVTTDVEGRFNLNALHRASGGKKKDGPSYWLALDTTKALISECEKQNAGISVVSGDTGISVSAINIVKGNFANGQEQGTFAHKLLAISYAGWISPSFQLQVNQVFLDHKTGGEPQSLQPQAQIAAFEYVKLIVDSFPNLGESGKQQLFSEASEIDFGRRLIPLPVIVESFYSATDLANEFGISANKIGRLANGHGLKTQEFGEFRLSKSKYSSKQIEQFYYNDKGKAALALIVLETPRKLANAH